MSNFERLVYTTGISDYMRFKNRCPSYWRKKPEERLWKRGWNHARKLCTKG